ncbi:flagellar biosynthesis anti-sigma factor protein FlgM [Desulfotomaculum nigrificans CO-1-SRB]|uniref:Negative regulator of flagellin synthesis n=1 Tax=Desulfotomaculum nigrificans (strain DSM 14880 / VKM B-2319 / CO-1-SRB) TaxID=868595 RepID=F6B8B1_DESCC|nr:flagellar biosynthesis anti-sigma factor FlgM [Desulfotomaculum nigrificans]AEF94675.1 flagellar biosynthesis anti-sigma factor protein FlgM [Desulfotomaculum nigrificans CO-1-SRB]
MKISGYKPTGEIFKAYQQNKIDKTKSPKASGGTVQTDSLELSPEARAKQEIQAKLKEIPEVREDLVNRLKKEIQNGTYKPDASKIADGIIQERLLDKEI